MSNEKTCLSCYYYDPYCSTDDYHNGTCDVTGNPVTKHDSACDAYRGLPDPVEVWTKGREHQ